jgi:hypothetical protein
VAWRLRGRVVRRLLIAFALLVLALPALLVLATNIVLQKRLRAWVNTDPERTYLEYADARSDFPGRVFVKGLVLRSRDANTEWIARVGEARLKVSLFDLTHKRFHATFVRGSGLSFRLRERLTPEELKPGVVERQPAIVGFPSPPRVDPAARERPEDPSTWRVSVEDLALDRVGEIWVEGFRFEGDGRVEGSFALHPTMTAEVKPSRLTISSGRLSFGRDPAVTPLSGKVRCSIPEFRTHDYPGNDIWKIIEGRARLGGDLPSLAFLNALLGDPERPRFGDAKGTIAMTANVGSGAGSGGMRIDAHDVVVRFGSDAIRSRSVADLKAKRVDFARGTADFSGSTLAIEDAVVLGRDAERGWSGRFTFAPSRFDMRTGLWTTRVAARATSPEPILTMLDVTVPDLSMKLIHMLDLDARADVELAKRRLEVHRLTAEGNGALVEGEYSKKGSAARGSFLVSKGILHVGVEVDGSGKAKLKVLRSRRWFEAQVGRPSAAAAKND